MIAATVWLFLMAAAVPPADLDQNVSVDREMLFGEGPGKPKTASAGLFNNEKDRPDLTGEDVRFTSKGKALYAFSMGWNPRETVIAALGTDRKLYEGKIRQVALLGYRGRLQWKQGEDALRIQMPEQKVSSHAAVFKIA
jgi:alpha-L-fucosidase